MSVVKHFIEDSIKKTEIDEFLQGEFERAGYGGVSITKTPLGTHLVIYTMRPGLVIGRGGETIRALATVLEEKYELPNPQISVAEIEIPELNAYVVASRIASALKRGIHYRRAGFWGLTQAMQAGALGAEIIISGKLRTDRARYEKFTEGYLPKSGEPPRKYMRKAELHVHLKPGTLGVKVRLLPPDAVFPDQVKVHLIEEPEIESKPEIIPEKITPEEKVSKKEIIPVSEEIKDSTPKSKIKPKKEKVVEKKPKPKKVKSKKEKSPKTKLVEEKKVSIKKKVKKVKAPVVESKDIKKELKSKKVKSKVATKKTTKKKVTPKDTKSNDSTPDKKKATKKKESKTKETSKKEKKQSKKKATTKKTSTKEKK